MSTVSDERGDAARPAMQELAEDPSSRKRFLRMMGGAGAASAFAIFLAACGGDDEEQSSASSTKKDKKKPAAGGDLEIVQYALTLEHLETDFYNAVIDSDVSRRHGAGQTPR